MITCSTPRFTSSRSTGASFMKFGRAPATERTRIASRGQLHDAQDRDRDRHEDPYDPDGTFGIIATRRHDAIARAQSHHIYRQAARKRVLETGSHVETLTVPLNLRAGEVCILRGTTGRHQCVGDHGAGEDGVKPGMLHFTEHAETHHHLRVHDTLFARLRGRSTSQPRNTAM